jgi:hypothetical protein
LYINDAHLMPFWMRIWWVVFIIFPVFFTISIMFRNPCLVKGRQNYILHLTQVQTSHKTLLTHVKSDFFLAGILFYCKNPNTRIVNKTCKTKKYCLLWNVIGGRNVTILIIIFDFSAATCPYIVHTVRILRKMYV